MLAISSLYAKLLQQCVSWKSSLYKQNTHTICKQCSYVCLLASQLWLMAEMLSKRSQLTVAPATPLLVVYTFSRLAQRSHTRHLQNHFNIWRSSFGCSEDTTELPSSCLSTPQFSRVDLDFFIADPTTLTRERRPIRLQPCVREDETATGTNSRNIIIIQQLVSG